MKFTVTKAQVIKAMKTEPLAAGSYFHYNHLAPIDGSFLEKKYSNNLGCPVCAVGAIIDTKAKDYNLDRNRSERICLNIIASSTLDLMREEKEAEVIANLLKEEKYLSALSVLFESRSEKKSYCTKLGFANYKMRKVLIDFVRKNFPSTIEIDTEKRNSL